MQMSEHTKARNSAVGLAKTDTKAALKIALAIDEPWFRSQALAWIARYSSQDDLPVVLGQARDASWSAEDPYRIVGSSAWRIRAMIERGNSEGVGAELSELLVCASRIAQPVS